METVWGQGSGNQSREARLQKWRGPGKGQLLRQEDHRSLTLPPSHWGRVLWGTSWRGVFRLQEQFVPELQSGLLCSMGLSPSPLCFLGEGGCLWALFGSRKKLKGIPAGGQGVVLSSLDLVRNVSLPFYESRLRCLQTTVWLGETWVDKKRRTIGTPRRLRGLRSPTWPCKAHPGFSRSSRFSHRPRSQVLCGLYSSVTLTYDFTFYLLPHWVLLITPALGKSAPSTQPCGSVVWGIRQKGKCCGWPKCPR